MVSAFEKEIKSSSLPIWVESLIGVDWAMLHISPVYFGFGVPKGDGSAVILVPGFMGSDFYLFELFLWLRRIGYKPYLSGIGRNADCLNILSNKLVKTINRAHKETGKKVHLIGHSLGGILSRSAAVQQPSKISSVITLASPYRGVRSHPWVLEMAEKIRMKIFAERDNANHPDCYTGFCDCVAVTSLQNALPSSILQSAIYTKLDGIVDWRSCINDDSSTDFEVTSTHIGLAFNHQVYKHIATRLAKAVQE
jgi:pimeloyl-ACP methyl ester carboxylesterase